MIAFLVAAWLAVGCGGGEDESGRLPASGPAPHGQSFRLDATTSYGDDDVPSSWCLKLRYTTRSGDPGGAETCGQSPAPPVSGYASVDCGGNVVYIFGGIREGVENLRLAGATGEPTSATLADLPPSSGFKGSSYVIAAKTEVLPARLTASGKSAKTVLKLPARGEFCESVPGKTDGGEPFLTFPEP